jgi:hypothetical protein
MHRHVRDPWLIQSFQNIFIYPGNIPEPLKNYQYDSGTQTPIALSQQKGYLCKRSCVIAENPAIALIKKCIGNIQLSKKGRRMRTWLIHYSAPSCNKRRFVDARRCSDRFGL